MAARASATCLKEYEMLNIDPNTAFGARVERRLADELVIWLTTVRVNMTPDPSLVWFWWDEQTFLIYSKPDTQKLRNIARNPTVALNFDSDGQGGNVIVITGTARIDEQAPPVHQHPEYARKYAAKISGMGLTAESFGRSYSVAIRVTPTKLRGH
jgi:PPOX class probable F420-dependent enzyme